MVWGVVISVGNHGVQVQSESVDYSEGVTGRSHQSHNYWVEGGAFLVAPTEISAQSPALPGKHLAQPCLL